jgi:hypothetical protein
MKEEVVSARALWVRRHLHAEVQPVVFMLILLLVSSLPMACLLLNNSYPAVCSCKDKLAKTELLRHVVCMRQACIVGAGLWSFLGM